MPYSVFFTLLAFFVKCYIFIKKNFTLAVLNMNRLYRNIKCIVLTSVFCLVFVSQVAALGEVKIAGARQSGMGFSSIGLISVYSAYNNQAAGAFLEHPGVGLYYAPVFIGEGVSNISGVVAIPVKKAGTFGFSVNYFGYSQYNEKKFGISYAIKLAKYLSIGMQLDYLNAKISGYGSKNYATFELGFFSKPIDELAIALHVYNPLKLYVDKNTGEKIPSVLRLGITYEARKKFFISTQIDKDFTQKGVVFRAGVEYTLKDLISFRAGVASSPVTGSFGVGVSIRQGVTIDAAFSYMSTLGFQPHFGFIYELKKKTKVGGTTSKKKLKKK